MRRAADRDSPSPDLYTCTTTLTSYDDCAKTLNTWVDAISELLPSDKVGNASRFGPQTPRCFIVAMVACHWDLWSGSREAVDPGHLIHWPRMEVFPLGFAGLCRLA